MTSMTYDAPELDAGPAAGTITGGVDTHGLTHHGAVIDPIGRHLADREFPATMRGYQDLLDWMRSYGALAVVGVEGTGTYGAELARVLATAGVRVVEVDRPDRKTRRMRGKSDPIDAYAAATAVLAGRASGTPKSRDGLVEAVRVLRVARRSAVKARTQAMNQIRGLLTSAPASLREQFSGIPRAELVRTLARQRPGADLTGPTTATKAALRRLARRYRDLENEIAELDAEIGPLVNRAAPALLNVFGAGPETAGQLLTSAGGQPRPDAIRGRVRAPGRRRADPRILRTHPPPPPQPRRGPRREQRPAHHRAGTHALRPTHPRLRRTPHPRRTVEEGHHALSQTSRRPRGLPRTDDHTTSTNHPERSRPRHLTSIGASARPAVVPR